MLALPVLIGKLEEQLDGPGLEDFLMALEVVEAQPGPIGHLLEGVFFLVEAKGIVVVFLELVGLGLVGEGLRELGAYSCRLHGLALL